MVSPNKLTRNVKTKYKHKNHIDIPDYFAIKATERMVALGGFEVSTLQGGVVWHLRGYGDWLAEPLLPQSLPVSDLIFV